MTAQLSVLLSNIAQPTSGSTSSATSVLNSLSQAASIEPAAKATLTRLPDHSVAIQSPSQQAQRVALPSTMNLPQAQNPQLIALNQDGQMQAVLISTETGVTSSQVTTAQLSTLSMSLSSMLAAMPSQQSMRMEVQASAIQIRNNILTVSLPNGQQASLPLTPESAMLLSSEMKNNGKLLSIVLTPDSRGKWNIEITSLAQPGAKVAGAAHLSQGILPSDAKIGALITNALRTQGIAFSHGETTLPDTITKSLPSIRSPNTLQQVSMLTLKGHTLSSYSAANHAVLKYAVPDGSSVMPAAAGQMQQKLSSLSIPRATLLANSVSTTLAQQIASKDATSSMNSEVKAGRHVNTMTSALDPKGTQLQGSDVHKAIITLSRVLLSQTGSTQQALSQLTAILNGQHSGSDKTQNFINQTTKHLSGLNTNTLSNNGQALSQPTSDVNAGNVDPLQVNADSTTTVDKGGDGALRKTISQLAALLSGTGKNANSNTAISGQPAEASAKVSADKNQPTLTDDIAASESNKSKSTVEGKAVQTNIPTQSASDATLVARIHSLVNSPAIAVTPLALTSPIAASNFVQGLVALLQLSLAGRALSRQPSLKSQIDLPESIISKTIANASGTVPTSRVAQEVASLDSRTNFMANLKTLLANHQHSKVAQAEARVQGQDSFFYVLPSVSQHSAPPELLIQREPEKRENDKQQNPERRLWNVTMKLDIGDVGQLLAKSKIDTDTLTLDLYTSNDSLFRRVADTLPFLKRRLTDLGLNIEKMSFQRGHIPDTLNKRPHQIFETKV